MARPATAEAGKGRLPLTVSDTLHTDGGWAVGQVFWRHWAGAESFVLNHSRDVAMLCLLKPVHWNPVGYSRPGGHRATSGYPKDHGFGHEEWNNAVCMRIRLNGEACRAFHTENVGDKVQHAPGDTLVMMYASHDRVQQPVGFAGHARYVHPERDAPRLADIRSQIRSDELWADAWRVERVRRMAGGNQEAFSAKWKANGGLKPNWICPEASFVWLQEPVNIDAEQITGKGKLLSMFSSYTRISSDIAARVLDSVPVSARSAGWQRVREALRVHAPIDDVTELRSARDIEETTRLSLIEARLGQGRFREDLLRIHGGRCVLTGCGVSEILRASHIRPWCESNNKERLDPDNGLLLAAHADALFDRYLISFDDEGRLQTSGLLTRAELACLGLSGLQRIALNPSQRRYMAYHRREFERRQGEFVPGSGSE